MREAKEIVVGLAPLMPALEALAANELPDAIPQVAPLLHTICVLWATCSHYRKGDRIVSFFMELTNLLIAMVCLC